MSELTVTEDRWQIQQVVYRYCELVDALQWEKMGEVFSQDMEWNYNGEVIRGLSTLITTAQTNMRRDFMAATQHNVSNLRIEVDANTASCLSNFYAEHFGAGDYAGEICTMWGTYDDRLLRTADGWRITHRTYCTTHTAGDAGMVYGVEKNVN